MNYKNKIPLNIKRFRMPDEYLNNFSVSAIKKDKLKRGSFLIPKDYFKGIQPEIIHQKIYFDKIKYLKNIFYKTSSVAAIFILVLFGYNQFKIDNEIKYDDILNYVNEDITEKDITVTATHVEFQTSTINLDVHLFKGSNERQVHVTDGDNVQVHYILWDADTGEQLDEGDLPVTGGDDSRYIKGFGWAVIGLDIEEDRGFIQDTGTTHTVLLPPPIAYGNSEGHELENTWLRFEVKIDRMVI